MYERINKIGQLRQKYNVPTYVICKDVGIHINTLYSHEKCEAIPSLQTAFAYAKFWSKRLKRAVTVDELFADLCGGE